MITADMGIKAMLALIIDKGGPSECGLVEAPNDDGKVSWTFGAGKTTVEVVFSPSELSLGIDEFERRHLEPVAEYLVHETLFLPRDWMKQHDRPGCTYLGTVRYSAA